jgi:hypothetical protein
MPGIPVWNEERSLTRGALGQMAREIILDLDVQRAMATCEEDHELAPRGLALVYRLETSARRAQLPAGLRREERYVVTGLAYYRTGNVACKEPVTPARGAGCVRS